MADASYLAVRIALLTGPFVNLVRKREMFRIYLVFNQPKRVNPELVAARFLADIAKNVKNGQCLRRTVWIINQCLVGEFGLLWRDSLISSRSRLRPV